MSAAPEDDPWVATSDRLAEFTRLNAEGVLDEVPCLACGYPTLSERNHFHFCVVCVWKDDGSSADAPDAPSHANHGVTLRAAAAHIHQTGIFAAPDFQWTAPEYYTADVRTARAALVSAYERLRLDPWDPSMRQDVLDGRSRLMRAIASAMH